jgi:diguanylate cyclase (GGDEF)-like protein/PAS domain S-box-containing protein
MEESQAELTATDIAAGVQAERVRLLFELSRGALLASAAASFVTAFWLWPNTSRTAFFVWLAVVVLVLAATTWLSFGYRRRQPPASEATRWEKIYALRTLLGGLTWGSLVLIAGPMRDGPQEMFLILMLSGVSLAATGTLSPSRLCFYGFVFPTLLPLAAYLFASPQSAFAAAGWAVVAFALLLLSLHSLFYRNLLATIIGRFESEALAQEQQVIFDTTAEAIAFIRPHILVKCNRQFATLLGYSMEEIVGKPAWVWHKSYEDWKQLADDCLPIIRAGKSYRRVIQFRRKDGKLFWGEITGMAVDPDHLERGSVWMGGEITERLRTEAQLKASEARFRDLVSLSSDWYWEQDREFRFTRMSGNALERLGEGVGSLLGKARWELDFLRGVTPEQWQAHRERLQKHLPFRDLVYQVEGDDGETRWCSVSGKPVFDEEGEFTGYHGVGSDITERVRGAERYRHLAHHDTLTGLPNRRLLTDRLEQAVAQARRKGNRVALMLLDLDDFKIINDTQGHSAGDSVLVIIAQRLRASVRESDTVARQGGDEFVVLLPEAAHIRDAITVAEKIISAVREPVTIGERQYVLGVSIGLALFPDHAPNAERLMQHADIAMYQAKRSGGSTYQISSGMHDANGKPLPPQGDEASTRH